MKVCNRNWTDAFVSWGFRAYPSPRYLQICVNADSMQGDSMFHASLHILKHAVAFEGPLKNPLYMNWKLIK